MSSPLGTRVSVDLICRGCELEISGILLTVDLRVMNMSEFDVILGMDWLATYRVVIDCERRRVTAYMPDGTCVTFQGDKHDALCNTPKYTLVVFDMFRIFCKHNLNVL